MDVKPQAIPAVGDRYRLLHALGRGGAGVVYAAIDTLFLRRVAIKLIRHESTTCSAKLQILREFQLTRQIRHPCIVAHYDAGVFAHGVYLVMELAEGQSLQSLLNDGPLPWREATAIAVAACEGLAAVHERGMIHGDVKPANLLRTADGAVKLTDFDLARRLILPKASDFSTQLAGTPHFMSPEQCRGEPLDERTDVYSLGATYYLLLTGRAPYAGDTVHQIMFAHCSAPPPDPREIFPEIPGACAEIVARAMAKKRARRFDGAGEMQNTMRAVLSATHCADDRQGRACSPWRRGIRRSQAWRI